MGSITLQELESHLWESANILRGSIDSSDYKNYIFGLLFLKRVNDVFEEICHHLVDDEGWDLEDAEEERDVSVLCSKGSSLVLFTIIND